MFDGVNYLYVVNLSFQLCNGFVMVVKLAFIILIMILTVINKLFPACMCFLIKLPFQLTFELMNQLIAKCKRQTPRPPTNNTRSYIYTQERSPNTTTTRLVQNRPTSPHVIQRQENHYITANWTLQKGKYENPYITATAPIDDVLMQIFYNPQTLMTYDSNNLRIYEVKRPNNNIINNTTKNLQNCYHQRESS